MARHDADFEPDFPDPESYDDWQEWADDVIDEWIDWADDFTEYDYEEWDVTPDYEET